MAKAKAGEELRGVVAEVERLTAAGLVAGEEAARLRGEAEAMEAALKQARLTLMGHGFDVGFIDAVLT